MTITEFIQNNIEMIDENDFKSFFENAEATFYDDSNIDKLVRFLHEAGIYPEYYLEWLPDVYLDVNNNFEAHLDKHPQLFQHLADRQENHIVVKAAKRYLLKQETENTYKVQNPPPFIYNKKTSTSYVFARDYITDLIIEDSVFTLGNGVFARSPKLKTVKFGNKLRAIGPSVFEGCTQLEEILIPDSVKIVAESAFARCTSLKKIKFSSNQEKIDILTCAGCTHLSEVIIPEGITLIDSKAFRDCISLTTIDLPNSLDIIGDAAFRGSGLISFNSNTITIIGANAFENSISLIDLELNDQLINIKNRAFAQCTNLKEVTLPKSLSVVGNSIFADCNNSLVVSYYKESEINNYWSLTWDKDIKTKKL